MTTRRNWVCWTLVALAGSLAPAAAEQVGPAWGSAVVSEAGKAAPTRLAAELGLQAAISLAPAYEGARDGLAAIEEWNRGGNVPLRGGFTRTLPRVVRLDLDPASPAAASGEAGGAAWRLQADGALVWTVRLRVEQAHRVRLRLTDVKLPSSARFWLSSDAGDEAGPFGLELQRAAGDLWTPSVTGEVFTLEVRVPRGANGRVSLAVAEIMEIVQLDANGAPFFASLATEADESCLVEGRCITDETLEFIKDYRKAVARLEFIDSTFLLLCTGGLLNDLDANTDIPYLLTADRCINEQSVADTLEAAWDFHSASCGGPKPFVSNAPKSNGATLLAASAETDFALLRLHSVPGGRFFLGWNSSQSAVVGGTVLHRLSHPQGGQQMYSRSKVSGSPAQLCFGSTLDSFLYSFKEEGATFPGSTGAPAVLGNGQVVGQLRGRCGANSLEPCLATADDYALDGRFWRTYPSIAAFLEANGPCVEDATTECLLDGRFRATMRFRNAFDNGPVDADALRKPVTGFASPNFETVFFYFGDSNNIEAVLAMLDQGNVNGSGQPTIAVKLGTATPLRIEVTITDTTNGAVRIYTSEFGSQSGTTDFTAFVK